MQAVFNVASVACSFDAASVSLDGIPPLNRRKMSRAAKLIWGVLSELSKDLGVEFGVNGRNESGVCNAGVDDNSCEIPVIFASNLGEINRCITLLRELANDCVVSPNSFSLSVLNAPLASVGIQKGIHAPIIALSSDTPLASASISACAKLAETRHVCVLVFVEDLSEQAACLGFVASSDESGKLKISLENIVKVGDRPKASTKNDGNQHINNVNETCDLFAEIGNFTTLAERVERFGGHGDFVTSEYLWQISSNIAVA